MATDSSPAIRGLITQYEKMADNTQQIQDLITETDSKNSDLQSRLDSLQKETQDFDKIEQKLALSKDTAEVRREIETTKSTIQATKDAILHNNDLIKDKEKAIFDLETSVEAENSINQVESQAHQHSVEYRNQIQTLASSNQDALVKDLQDQLERLTSHIETSKTTKRDLEKDIKERRGHDVELRTQHEQGSKLLHDHTKPPFDELKLRQTQRENKTLKYRIDQAIKEGDGYAAQLISIKGKKQDLTNEIKIMESYKVINEQMRAETEQLNEEYSKLKFNEKQIREQNQRVTKQLNDARRKLAEKDAEFKAKSVYT